MITISRHDRYIVLAENAAKMSSLRQTLGAVVVRSGRVLAVAANRYRNDPSNVPGGQAHVHAERAAVSLVHNPAKATLYVLRLSKAGQRTMARPCQICMVFLVEKGISRIVYTDWTGNIVFEKLVN